MTNFQKLIKIVLVTCAEIRLKFHKNKKNKKMQFPCKQNIETLKFKQACPKSNVVVVVVVVVLVVVLYVHSLVAYEDLHATTNPLVLVPNY